MHLLHLSSNKIGEFFATICLTDFGGIVANGKAGAYFPGLDQFEATRLRFRTHQDALDFADHIVQKANWLSSIYNFGRVVQLSRR